MIQKSIVIPIPMVRRCVTTPAFWYCRWRYYNFMTVSVTTEIKWSLLVVYKDQSQGSVSLHGVRHNTKSEVFTRRPFAPQLHHLVHGSHKVS